MKFFINIVIFLLVSFVVFELAFNLFKLVLTFVFSKALKLKISEVGFLGLKLERKEDNRLSFKVEKPKALSYCTINEADSIKKRGAVYLAPHVICLLASIIYVLSIKTTDAFSNYAFMAFVAGLVGIVNEVRSFIKLVRFFLEERPSAKVEKFNKDMLNAVNQGVRPINFDMVEFKPYSSDGLDASYLTYLYLKFCYFLEKQSFVDLKPIVNAFVNNMPKEFNEVYTPQAYSLLFYYSYIDVNPVLANNYYYYVENQILKDSDANSFRVYAYYLYFIKNDRQKAYDTAIDGLKLCEKMQDKGFSYMEKDLIEHLISIIENGGDYSAFVDMELNTGFNKSFS